MTTVLNLSEGRQGDILARLITSVTARLLSVDSSLVEWMRPRTWFLRQMALLAMASEITRRPKAFCTHYTSL